MTAHTPPQPQPPAPPQPAEREPYVGLRLRLWLTCVSGGAIAGLGSLWVLGTRVRPEGADPSELLAWLSGVAIFAVVLGLLLALWLDHHIVGHLRGLLRGLRSGRVTELRGLPAAAGWGELSELTEVAQGLLGRQRQNTRAAEELEHLRTQIAALQKSIDRWTHTEAWEPPAPTQGPLSDLSSSLAHGLSRRTTVDEQNQQVARQVADELASALADAQESAEQAERGFVEATAMLTTVRELQRLSGELQNALAALGTSTAPPDGGPTRDALEELVRASQESVESIGRGMLRVQDVSELVQQLANRATLVAIHAVTGGRDELGGEELATELKQLVTDVRDATDRTSQFSLEIETAVAEANDRMRVARERAAARLVETPASGTTGAAGTRAYDDAQRLLERVREMVQDAARKGERLSAAGERASRAAERLARRVGEETVEAQALAVRLTPVGTVQAARETPTEPHELHLLEDETEEAPTANDDEANGEERP